MKKSKLISSLAIAFMLGASCVTFADEPLSDIQAAAKEKSEPDDQVKVEKPVAKSGTVMATALHDGSAVSEVDMPEQHKM